MDKVEEILTRGAEEVLPDKKGLARLMRKKKIRVYLGIDPTGTKLHLGHSIPLRKLQQFADLGHEVILLMGTGTVLAGDPSQRDSARPKITAEEIQENIKTWKNQVEKIIDFSKVTIKQNGDWLLKLNLAKILEIASHVSAFQLIKRDMFQERNKHGDTVWTHEILYPLLQGYDSVVMDVDLEIGGTDQTFNMLVGRELQRKINNREKYVLTVPMILGTDGKPMSKTSGNCIWLKDDAFDMFAKVMSIPDSQIQSYFTLLTDIPLEEINLKDPLQAKKRLAFEIVRQFHNQDIAEKAQDNFEKTVQGGQLPQDIPTVETLNIKQTIIDILVEAGLATSKSDAKRLIEQNGVEVNNQKVADGTVQFESLTKNGQAIIRVGKFKFLKIKTAP